jgi:4-diphosphocytidyl-2-C-methyl-D-erythritol kinase
MTLKQQSPGKINLLLNILGRRADGFHELESVFHPVALYDTLSCQTTTQGLEFTCDDPRLPTDDRNLVCRAARLFLAATGITAGLRLHLEKRIPPGGGLGGGSGNAAHTLRGLNALFDRPLTDPQLHELAARLGSDVPFFLQDRPALVTGRGEHIEPLDFFPGLRGRGLLLVHPGFGISTAWAYQQLARFPQALNGQPGRARQLVERLQAGDSEPLAGALFNSLEAPVFAKYPVLALYQEFLRAHGALATLMSGSGSTTFAVVESIAHGETLAAQFKRRFGSTCWTAVVPLAGGDAEGAL